MWYTYKCPRCGREYGVDFPIGYAEPTAEVLCTEHGRTVGTRVYGISGVVFKGRGFYTTDSRKFVDVDTSKVPKHMLDR